MNMRTDTKETRINRALRICNIFFIPLFIIGLFFSFTISYNVTLSLVYAPREPYAVWDVDVIEGFEETKFHDIEFINVTHGWLVGSLNRPAILHTNDGGLTWSVQYENEDIRFRSLSIPDPKNIWAGSNGRLLHSIDGGISWTDISILITAPSIVEFYNESYGCVGSTTGLLVTTDGGLTWQETSSWSDGVIIKDISITQTIIRIATSQGIYLSKDAGTTWTKEISNPTDAICFVDNNTIWAAHYDTFSVYDGNIWIEQTGATLLVSYSHPRTKDIEFLDENTGWTVGGSPAIAHTLDGGRTWYDHGVGHISLNAIDIFNESHCWAAGRFGVVARTTTGNLFGPKLYRGFYMSYMLGAGGRTLPYEPFFVALFVSLSFGVYIIHKRRKYYALISPKKSVTW